MKGLLVLSALFAVSIAAQYKYDRYEGYIGRPYYNENVKRNGINGFSDGYELYNQDIIMRNRGNRFARQSQSGEHDRNRDKSGEDYEDTGNGDLYGQYGEDEKRK